MATSWKPNILGFSIRQLLERFSLSGYAGKKRFATALARLARAVRVVERRAALVPTDGARAGTGGPGRAPGEEGP